MAYPNNKPSGEYALRNYDFATLDTNKLPIDEYLFKNGYKNAEESLVDSVPDAHNVNWLYDVILRNLKYTQDVSEENKNLLEKKIASTTNIGQVKIGYGLEITSNGTLSVTKSVAESANIISYDLPVGSYILWSGINTPEFFIEPAGQTLLKSNYSELWNFAQTNSLVGKLFEDIDATSFRVKDVRKHFIRIAENDANVGKFTEAGLPNITGTLSTRGANGKASGAFTVSGTNQVANYDSGSANASFSFDASRSNPIYGKNSTVMPANWGLKLILKALPTPPSNSVPTGTILDYTGSIVPDGFIPSNGAELSRVTFKTLFDWADKNGLIIPQSEIPNTAHAYYGSGDGSTTFTIPDLRGVYSRWADMASDRGGADVGVYQEDGLPNIEGTIIGNKFIENSVITGSFYSIEGGSTSSSGSGLCQGIGFDASRSNPIYGRTTEVRVKSVTLYPILKY